MRFDPLVFGLLFSSAAGLAACGSDSSKEGDAAGDAAEAPGDGSEVSSEPRFAIEGRGESAKLSTVLDVVEGEELSRLAITGSDAADNLIAIYATFHGVETVVGSHVLPIQPVADAESFAVGTIDGRVYQSESGELRLTITSDWHSEGEFELTLALDEAVPATPGAEAGTVPATELRLVGTFESEWRVNCRSYISGFTGGHAVADSPYCQALTF